MSRVRIPDSLDLRVWQAPANAKRVFTEFVRIEKIPQVMHVRGLFFIKLHNIELIFTSTVPVPGSVLQFQFWSVLTVLSFLSSRSYPYHLSSPCPTATTDCFFAFLIYFFPTGLSGRKSGALLPPIQHPARVFPFTTLDLVSPPSSITSCSWSLFIPNGVDVGSSNHTIHPQHAAHLFSIIPILTLFNHPPHIAS